MPGAEGVQAYNHLTSLNEITERLDKGLQGSAVGKSTPPAGTVMSVDSHVGVLVDIPDPTTVVDFEAGAVALVVEELSSVVPDYLNEPVGELGPVLFSR